MVQIRAHPWLPSLGLSLCSRPPRSNCNVKHLLLSTFDSKTHHAQTTVFDGTGFLSLPKPVHFQQHAVAATLSIALNGEVLWEGVGMTQTPAHPTPKRPLILEHCPGNKDYLGSTPTTASSTFLLPVQEPDAVLLAW